MRTVSIVGGGLAGSLLALYLVKKNYQVYLFEKREDLRITKPTEGRSINLALSFRGMRALEDVGLLQRVLKNAVPVIGRMMHNIKGVLSTQAYGRTKEEKNYAISRYQLNCLLLDLLEKHKQCQVHFNHELVAYDEKNNGLLFTDKNKHEVNKQSTFVFGTDGAYSSLRRCLEDKGFIHTQLDIQKHGYKELICKKEKASALDLNYLHIWPRDRFMLMALANADGSQTCTLYLPHEGEESFFSLDNEQKVWDFFDKHFKDMLSLMPNLGQQFFNHPTGRLVSAKVKPWQYDNKVLLLGDAAHAMVPFLGQGMNCAFEDVRLLVAAMERNVSFDAFCRQRKKDTDAITQMALENYYEMREAVGKAAFLFKKEVEHALMQRYPEKYVSKYVLISYSHMPYARVQKITKLQNNLVDTVCAGKQKLSDIDFNKVDKCMDDYLEKIKSI